MKSALIKSALLVSVLLGAEAQAAQQINLTAGPANATLPDGTSVPMWGYTCGAVVTGSTATCVAANPVAAAAGGWSPVVITVPYGQDLTISLTNNLSFTPTGATTANGIPTSLLIPGQVGGGLGTPSAAASPAHTAQGTSWFVANAGPSFAPPAQGGRVQSFGTEVAPGTTAALTWTAPRPGTYLLESGTHPSIQVPMGLYGMVVVTTAPVAATTTGTAAASGCAYPNSTSCPSTGVQYDAEVAMLMSEIDPVQNAAVAAAVNTAGFSETAPYRSMQNQLNSVLIAAAGSGYLVTDTLTVTGGGCTTLPTASIGTVDSTGAITSVNVTKPGLNCSSIPTITISSATGTGAALSASMAVNGIAACGPATGSTTLAGACYPPAVNYTPTYFLFNGQAFDKTNAATSVFAASPSTIAATGKVLVRFANAGLRMHVPSLVNTVTGDTIGNSTIPLVPGMTLIAEDGNPVPPSQPRVQSSVFLSAGKTYDVMYTLPAANAGVALTPVFDRELSLSSNALGRDGGMLAYISIGGGTLPTGASAIPSLGSAVANADTYNSLVAGQSFSVTDPSKGLIANDVNVYGVTLLTPPTNGTVVLAANGTFTYTPTGTTTNSDSFTYCANGTVTGAGCSSGITATVTLGSAAVEASTGITCQPQTFTANTATSLNIKSPGVLAFCTDAAGYPLTVAGSTAAAPLSLTAGPGTVVIDPAGGFTATGFTAGGPYTFQIQAQNSQGTAGAKVTMTLNFPAASNLQVTVLDPTTQIPITDYRWIIEEDQTFFVDPNCTTNPIDTTKCTTVTPQGAPFGFGTNFHTSHMPVVATGCTGPLSCESGQTLLGTAAVCDVGNGICRTTASQQATLDPSAVKLDPTKRYYISVLPGDAANPAIGGNLSAPTNCGNPYNTDGSLNTNCGHGMGGAAIPAPCLPKTIATAGNAACIATGQFAAVTVMTQPTPFPTGKLTVHVFEDDFPLDGIFSPGGGVDVVAPNEPGLGGFSVVLLDAGGGPGDATGQVTYDMFNQPLSNSLAGMIDPVTGNDACPLSAVVSQNAVTGDGSQAGVMGMIVTCPKYESDGVTLSPMAGMAVIANLPPARYSVVANPSADRIAAGEEWLQTNTLDGQKGHDAFIRVGEPAYFQEYGPSGFHVDIGFANPAIINSRLSNAQGTGMCDAAATGGTAGTNLTGGGGLLCNNIVKGHVTSSRLSRAPDERIYGSRTRDSLSFTQCYVSLGDPDGFDFAFAKCDADGNFTFNNIPAGNWKITTFDQWNDQIIDGITTPVALNCPQGTTSSGLCTPAGGGMTLDMGEIAVHQWQANIYTRTFMDLNGNGISDKDPNTGNDTEPGLPLEAVNNRWRDGSFSNFNNTDLNGYANYNEVFPLFNWYVFEGYTTRYKTTGVHVVMDAGGPVDVDPTAKGTLCNMGIVNGAAANGDRACGVSNIAANMANTYDLDPLPADIGLPGTIYCGLTATADCVSKSISAQYTANNGFTSQNDAPTSCTPNTITTSTGTSMTLGVVCPASTTGRIDPPYWFGSYGWQGFIGQNQFLEFGKKPYAPGETGGIRGHVVYASTRPFDDPQLLLQNQWEPLIPRVTINLYKEGVDTDGVTPTLTLIDTTTTSSFDDWAQGFRSDGKPNISCSGQSVNDNLFYALANQPTYLDWYNNVLHGSATAPQTLPYNSQYKCYDGMHSWNQLQPVPYDGLYVFPSVTGLDPVSGRPSGTNCTACVSNVDQTDNFRYGGSTTPVKFVNPALNKDGTIQPGTGTPGTPVLPPGKYVVEVVIPSGYELVKEEDKNILIGDNFIAPATVQFPGLGGSIFILPDQASLAAEMNSYNAQNATQNLGRVSNLVSHEGDTGSVESYWPCVGALRTVPDYISLFPQSQQVAPFAGAVRNLCDRKEVTLTDQSSAQAKFYLFTSTHVASHFTGVILDDFTGEFDPFSPQWGEKFAPAYLPVSVKDWAGNEVNRVYSDEFGLYNGLNYSTWEVNPPNPTGYGPTMMVMCMNDSGQTTKSPWWDTTANGTTSATPDPFFQQGYSTFCYELAFMPGQTGYFDTPVVPVASFSEGYNHPDCNYADATPAIKEVDGDGIGPWVAQAGHTITITALGDQLVENYAYSGPGATTAPYNQIKIKRHYGFGNTTGTVTLVTPDGTPHALTIGSWTDGTITGTVPAWTCGNNNSNCPLQQQSQYQAVGLGAGQNLSPIKSAQLVITNANGQTSTDAVTVWVGGKPPTHVAASGTIQAAIDQAAPGDLIIVDPTCNAAATGGANTQLASCTTPLPSGSTLNKTSAAHNEMVQMWKPVRLQGVGAASSIIDANTQPAGKLLDPWRLRINCLVGLTPTGRPRPLSDMSCTNGWAFASGGNDYPTMLADRLPFEAMLGWDATLNGNVAEQLIEPSLLGAYEGAAITVLAKGVQLPSPNDPQFSGLSAAQILAEVFGAGTTNVGAAYPTNTNLLATNDCKRKDKAGNPEYPTSFYCNPSSIDGLGVRDSSQGGGGIFGHAFVHNLQVANNRIYNNTGTLGGGITIGLGEHADAQQAGSAPTQYPGSCENGGGLPNGALLPYCYNMNVNVHHNFITQNSSMGDELFSSTPAGAGGVVFNTGDDNYRFTNNWVCGNLSAGDGGGIAHIGFSNGGTIAHNTIIFNESTNPTITTNGGGLLVMGAPDADPTTCGVTTDIDCVPAPATISPSDGIGRGLVIDANLILGNAASSGSGGGLRLQHVNGMDVVDVPDGNGTCKNLNNCAWNSANVTNNIIANNVAGWDGAGVSLQDTLVSNFVNNTIVDNDSTASSGVLLSSLFAASASAGANTGGITGNVICGSGQSCPQVAGLVAVTNSPVLMANLRSAVDAGQLTCPRGHGGNIAASSPSGFNVPSCFYYSEPVLENDVIYDNHAFYIGVGGKGPGQQNQQNVVTLYNASFTTAAGTPAASQTYTGSCPAGATDWEIGVRGDTGPTNHGTYADSDPTFTASVPLKLAPTYSDLSDGTSDYGPASTTHNLQVVPQLTSVYCNGARTPPENGGAGYLVPPGTIEANGLPNPVFTLTPSAVVDEGNNWVNLRWGPLSLTNPNVVDSNGNYGGLSAGGVSLVLGNYAPQASSPLINAGTSTTNNGVTPPATDFYGNARVAPYDIGAIEYMAPPPTLTSITPNSGMRGTTVAVTLTGTNLASASAVTMSGGGITCTIGTATATSVPASCVITIGANLTVRNVTVTTAGGSVTLNGAFTVTAPAPATLTSILPTSGTRGTSVGVTLTGTNFTPGSTLAVSGNGITVSGVTIVSSTSITATFAITTGANETGRNVTVTNNSGTASNAVTFTVTGPTLTGISPTTGVRGTTVPVTLTGTNLSGATGVTISGGNVTCTGVTATSSTTVTANCAIARGESLGSHNASVTTNIGTTNNVPFEVQGATLTLSAPSPALTTTTANTTTKNGVVTVTNTATGATAGAFTFTATPAVTKVGTAGGTFSSPTGGTCISGFVLNPGASCTVNVQYAPGTSTATATANVTVTGSGLGTATQTGANFSAN
ncbi:MAG: hypothetical protein JSR73_15335 [Proteobacteria bacterium]|nr:hypothetical protein [Pseudomonadota bacterium]